MIFSVVYRWKIHIDYQSLPLHRSKFTGWAIISFPMLACRSEVKCQTTWYSSFHLPCTQPAIGEQNIIVAMASLDIYKTTQMNKRREFCKKNNWFEIRNTTEDRGQSIPKSIGILTVLRCILVQIWKSFNQWWLITWTNSQSQNGVNFYFEVNLTLKAKVNHHQKHQGSSLRSFTPMVQIWWS